VSGFGCQRTEIEVKKLRRKEVEKVWGGKEAEVIG
jgi:hypothetical protein